MSAQQQGRQAPTIRLNPVDRLINFFSPVAGLRRLAARRILNQYEAAKPSRLRKGTLDHRAPDTQVTQGAVALRALARNLEQNHDIARGALRILVNNVVGPAGIGIEPQPRRRDGTIHEDYAKSLREAYRDWQKKPEVTQQHRWSRAQRLVARTWFRDGEVFSQRLMGNVPALDHGTRVPYSLELLEPDMVPMDYYDESRGIQQGIQRNTWGKPTAYWVYKAFPIGDRWTRGTYEMKPIQAAQMLHVKAVDRIGQLRGVSEFASVVTRLEDIKDYEESERIAAKVAASLTAYIKKGDGQSYGNPEGGDGTKPGAREIQFSPGMIIDDLQAGEEIGLIDSNRPNPNLVTFRQGQLRAVAAGIGTSYSSTSRDYSGTYSAQRQELVEQWVNYAVLTDEFVGQFVQPVWEDFVLVAHLSGVVKMPPDVDPDKADDCLFVGQSMPWIDPLKEALAWESLVQNGFASEVEVQRKRGVNPNDTIEQISTFRTTAKEKGLVFGSDFANHMKVGPEGQAAKQAKQNDSTE